MAALVPATVTIQRGGKTYVFTTDKELTPPVKSMRDRQDRGRDGPMPGRW